MQHGLFHTPQQSRAVVIGGGVAGLLAARVLADHVDQVTIVERDRLPDEARFRAGVPQSRHVHQLLARGRAILEQLFPGIARELLAAGAPAIDWPADLVWLTPNGWGLRYRAGIETIGCSRELLEWTIRRRLIASPKIAWFDGWEVDGLLANERAAEVTGVRLRQRGHHARPAPRTELCASLIVDASGRDSHLAQWLTMLGYAMPPETIIDAAVGYASRVYRRPAGFDDWKMLVFQRRLPDRPRGAVILPLEGERWLVTLSGTAPGYPPTDEAAFLEFARSLPHPLVYEALRTAEPLSSISGYRRTENRRRHFERLAAWPERLIVLGDAACAFNPVYGQGMTVAAQSALLLGEVLEENGLVEGRSRAGVAQRFHRRLAKLTATPWMMAIGEDRRNLGEAAATTRQASRPIQRYLEQVRHLAVEDAAVNKAFLQVMHLLEPPTTLFRPWIVKAVLRRRTGSTVRGLCRSLSRSAKTREDTRRISMS